MCSNAEDESTFVISCGMTAVSLSGEPIEDNEMKIDQMDLLDDVPSIPFSIEFTLPVIKVMCGDLFSGLLTAEGHVYTWGHNRSG